MSLLGRLVRRLRAERSADPTAFAVHLGRWGAFVAQKTVMDYCGVKLGVNWDRALAEPDFAAALGACRWRVYLAAQGDLAALAEAWLRPHATGRRSALAEALARLAAAAVAAARPPAHLGAEAEAARRGYRALLARRQLAPPQPADTLALDAAAVLLETLPIHPDLRRGEQPAILGGLRMNLLVAQAEMERRFAPAPLAAALLATPP